MSAPIAVSGLTKRFGAVTAVDDLSFDVLGGVTGFVGANGAGKTTTIRALLGLIAPTRGSALIRGRPYARLSDPSRLVGTVLDGMGFHPKRRAVDHLRVMTRSIGVSERRATTALEQVGLAGDGDRRVGTYSLGMKQRLRLASALLGGPEILILDEPTIGLDPEGIRWLRDFLRSFASAGGTVLFSSHQLAEMAQIADCVVVVDRGRLVGHGTIAELAGGCRAVRVRAKDLERLSSALVAAGHRVTDEEAALVAWDVTASEVSALAHHQGIVLQELSPVTRSLEEAVLELVGGAAR